MARATNWVMVQIRRTVQHPTREIIVFVLAVALLVYGDGSPTGEYASQARSFGMLLAGGSFVALLFRDSIHHEAMSLLKQGDLDFPAIKDRLGHEWTWRDDLGTPMSWFRRD